MLLETSLCYCRVWLGVLANVLLITGPLALAQNPVGVVKDAICDAQHTHSTRGKVFAILAGFFFVEGLGILAQPNLAQRVRRILPATPIFCVGALCR